MQQRSKHPDVAIHDQVWRRETFERMLFGRALPDDEAGDNTRDEECSSWYMQRCRAYDKGSVDMVLDAIQHENAVAMIPDLRVRAAVTLAQMGWDFADIGAAINDRRPGRLLVKEGVRQLAKGERNRAEINGHA